LALYLACIIIVRAGFKAVMCGFFAFFFSGTTICTGCPILDTGPFAVDVKANQKEKHYNGKNGI